MLNERRDLELHGGKWRFTVVVPRSLHGVFGTRLKHSLGTDSLAAANRLKREVVREFQGRIGLCAADKSGGPGPRLPPHMPGGRARRRGIWRTFVGRLRGLFDCLRPFLSRFRNSLVCSPFLSVVVAASCISTPCNDRAERGDA